MRENRLRSLWKAGDAAVNGWLAIPNGFSAEVMAGQGFGAPAMLFRLRDVVPPVHLSRLLSVHRMSVRVYPADDRQVRRTANS